ncbi:MAG TPA: type II CAAX endopeptidase family protein [Chthoniobacteraceae bacterium]|nr:type II CAAX endopeptidase family protein [Chthoniobacteraceae bacterium]
MQTPPPLPGNIPIPASRARWSIHLLLVTAYIVLIGFLGMQRKPSHTPALLHGARGLLLVCGTELLVFGAVLGLACWISKATRDDLLLRWRGKLLPVWLGIGYSFAIRIAVGLVLSVVLAAVAIVLMATHIWSVDSLDSFVKMHKPDPTTLVDMAAMANDPAYFWLTVTFASFVVAGLREELWRSAFLAGMRSIWPRAFGSRGGQIMAVCIAAVPFGAAHLPMGPLAAVSAGLLGIALGVIMVCHRSIWPAVIAHGCFDAATFAALPWLMKHFK